MLFCKATMQKLATEKEALMQRLVMVEEELEAESKTERKKVRGKR